MKQKLEMSAADVECLRQARKHLSRALEALRGVEPMEQQDGQHAVDQLAASFGLSLGLIDNLVTRARLDD